MDFTTKFLLFCVVFNANLFCFANGTEYPFGQVLGQACAVQYLQEKGKLNDSLQSIVPPPSRCRLVIPLVLQATKSFFREEILRTFPLDVANCLIIGLDSDEAFDYSLKSDIIETSSLFSGSEKIAEIKEADKFTDVVRKIKAKCGVDESNANIFNETLEDHQHNYCLVEYALDNQLLELNNTDINPHHIDTESINCTNIVNAERIKTEKEYSDKLSGHGSEDCVVNEFRSGKMFDWKVALFIFKRLDITNQTYRVSNKVDEFLSLSTSACNLTD